MRDHIPSLYGQPAAASSHIIELERQLGFSRSAPFEHITDAWDRIEILEDLATKRGYKVAQVAYNTHDQVVVRIAALETQLGLPKSTPSDSATDAKGRLAILEELAAGKGNAPRAEAATPSTSSAPTAPSATAPVPRQDPAASRAEPERVGLARVEHAFASRQPSRRHEPVAPCPEPKRFGVSRVAHAFASRQPK